MGSFLMLLAVLMKWADILQMQLFQINQSEESSKITINAHTTSSPLPMEYSSLPALNVGLLSYLELFENNYLTLRTVWINNYIVFANTK